MALTLVQSATLTPFNNPSSSPNTTTASKAFASANTAGNMLIAVGSVSAGNVNGTPSITDTAGNTWVLMDGNIVVSGRDYAAFWYCASCVGASNTVSFTWAWGGLGGFYDAANESTLQIYEYSGASGSLVQSLASSSSTSVSVTDSRGVVDTLTCSGSVIRSVFFDLANGSVDNLFFHLWSSVVPGSITITGTTGLAVTQVNTVTLVSGKYLTFYTVSGSGIANQRGNIDYDQIRVTTRKGNAGRFQMAGAAAFTSGNLLKFDANGNAIDSGASAAGLTASVMVASGASHAAGLAPDPGSTAGTTKFLREDATWAVPAGGGGGSGIGFPFTILQDKNFVSGASNVTSFTVTFPVALQASGATAFMVVSCAGEQTVNTPAGWTVDVNQQQNTYARLIVLHKTSASDTSATFTVASGSSFAVHFFELSGARTVNTSSSGGQANANIVTFPNVTPASGALVMGYVAVVSANTFLFTHAQAGMMPCHVVGQINSPQNGGRGLIGVAYDIPVANTNSIAPPAIYLNQSLFASGGMAYATLAIA